LIRKKLEAGVQLSFLRRPPINAWRRIARSVSLPLWLIGLNLIVILALLVPVILQSGIVQRADTNPSSTALPAFKRVANLSLSYSKLPGPPPITIATGAEHWQGPGITPNFATQYGGASSLMMHSSGGIPAVATLQEQLNLSQMDLFELYLDGQLESKLSNSADPLNIESLSVAFLSTASNQVGFQAPIYLDGPGWTPLSMVRQQFEAFGEAGSTVWRTIGSVRITLVALPGTSAIINIGLFRAQADANVSKGWTISNPQLLGLIATPSGKALYIQDGNAPGSSTLAGMAGVGDVSNFMLTAQIAPITTGSGGIFFRGNTQDGEGTFFLISGEGQGWQLQQNDSRGSVILAQGVISNTIFQPYQPYWLRSVVLGNQITLYLSRDGVTFTRIASLRHSTVPLGEVGLAVFDDSAFAVYNVSYESL